MGGGINHKEMGEVGGAVFGDIGSDWFGFLTPTIYNVARNCIVLS